MPFDATIGANTDPRAKPFLAKETGASEFVPDIHHIQHDITLNADGSVLAMLWQPGLPFELESMNARNIQRRQLVDLLKSISDDNVTVCFTLVNHDHTTAFRWNRFRSRYAEQIMRRYEANCLDGRLMTKDWFITVIVAPRFVLGQRIRQRMLALGRKPRPKAGSQQIQQLDNAMSRILSYMAPYGARRLGLRRSIHNGLLCSEIAEARRLILYGRWQEIPLTTGDLARAIYNERILCGTKFIRINHPGTPRWAKTLSIFDYPAGDREEDGTIVGGTYTGQFSGFLQLRDNFPFVVSQSFRFQARGESETRLYLKSTRMQNFLSGETRQLEGLQEARQDIAGGDVVRGYHSFTWTVFGDTPAEAAHAANMASTAMIKAGVVPIMEDSNTFATFWLALPGQVIWLEGRSGSISNKNFTALAPLEGFPVGDVHGHWGPPIIRLRTLGRTAYDWLPHVGDIGHALFLGRSTSGKTLLMTLLLCALEQYDGTTIYFDKDAGAEPAIRATGGTYFALRDGEASGMAPLYAAENTPAWRSFLVDWIGKLITSDMLGPLKTATPGMILRAVTRQLRLPPEQRSMSAIRAFLGFGPDYDGDRLERWCRGNSLGWLFDNYRDEIKLDAKLIGLNMGQLLTHFACPFAGAYLVFRISQLIDGRRITVVCDECRAYLLVDLFADLIEDFSLRLRKLNGQLWLAAQAPEHITQSKTGLALAQQAQTIWAFPQRNASREEFCGKLNFSAPMFKALTETMPTLGHRSVLMYRESGSAIIDIHLHNMEDDILVLSGRKETCNNIPGILAEIGDDSDRFADLFITRAHETYTAVNRQKGTVS